MYRDLTKGSITKGLLLFALPMIAGNLLQQFYNIADTLIVGRALGTDALASVGSAYTLMGFLTSVLLGLSMGAGALLSIYLGKNDADMVKAATVHAFVLLLAVTVLVNAAVYAFLDPILRFLQIPSELVKDMREYLEIIFAGLLMRIFIKAEETAVLAAGVHYLRIEGAFYIGIGCLFLLYGFCRAIKRPGMSVVLTVISLGTRVALAYLLAGPLKETGIWLAIPIGWALADVTGYSYYFLRKKRLLLQKQK